MTQYDISFPKKAEDGLRIIVTNSNKHRDTIPRQKDVFPDELDWSNIHKAQVSLKDSLLWIRGDIKKDYRIFGYERPSTNSKRLILFSVFTRDVENNPYNCPFGAYYSTSDMAFEDTRFKFKGVSGDFVKTDLISEGVLLAAFYFEKKWVQFSK
jgi:hypothetical protein